jgi:hypothetical protein
MPTGVGVCLRRRRRRIGRSVLLRLGLRQCVGNEPGNRSGADRRAPDEERTARFIMLAHAWCLPTRYELVLF